MARDRVGGDGPGSVAGGVVFKDEEEFDTLLAEALHDCKAGDSHVLLELDVVRADGIEHRFGEDAAAAVRSVLNAELHRVLGSAVPVTDAGHCGLVALLRDVSCEQAAEMAGRIRALVERCDFRWHQHPLRLGSHIGVVQLGPKPAMPSAWRKLSRDVSAYALELGGTGVQLLPYGEHALENLRGEKNWHEHIMEIIA